MYYGCFKSLEDVLDFYHIEESDLIGCTILFAAYDDSEGYSGYSFVLFEREGKLYEVNASHCSGYDLEGQWEPEETTIEALEVTRGGYFVGIYDDQLKDFLTAFKQGNQ
ncbi:hypothetical protein AVT69_gp035 [Pseudomonas phage PhiPA3]|uniref:Uncharacterized protein 034 n=1 Tax=Pseudomonas phage PhiPA3 TaxID=998086 RepID=F8SJR6_BPPA3|nr:hypothetical protein AVT69_gp035 [Pseudomonas phage PhiPA3]AEH03461.1 hypothetical protein [Pseudomonas phage PhiPA3]